jgi:hypothetical protein
VFRRSALSAAASLAVVSSHAVMSVIAGTFASDFRNGKHWSSA